jgi:hypothetical protein
MLEDEDELNGLGRRDGARGHTPAVQSRRHRSHSVGRHTSHVGNNLVCDTKWPPLVYRRGIERRRETGSGVESSRCGRDRGRGLDLDLRRRRRLTGERFHSRQKSQDGNVPEPINGVGFAAKRRRAVPGWAVGGVDVCECRFRKPG